MEAKTFTAKQKVNKILQQTINSINEVENKRTSLPNPNLTETELEVLKAIATGRGFAEIQTGIKLTNKNDSYYSVVQRLMRKFEAASLAHCVYKAIKIKIIN